MNNQEKVWKVGKWVGILLVVFLAIISVKELKSIGYVGKDTPVFNSITVNGKGEAISIPDIATFSFGVTENAKMVEEAQDKATEKINLAIKALKDGGVEEKDIKTIAYNINPHYDYTSSRSILNGYDVSQTIEVKVRDLNKAGALFAAIGALNVQNVNGLNFSIDDIDTIKQEARELAIDNAKEKAKMLSKQLGVKLVRITSFYDSSEDQPIPYYGREGMVSDMMSVKTAVAPQIPTGEQKITSVVSITYEIK